MQFSEFRVENVNRISYPKMLVHSIPFFLCNETNGKYKQSKTYKIKKKMKRAAYFFDHSFRNTWDVTAM